MSQPKPRHPGLFGGALFRAGISAAAITSSAAAQPTFSTLVFESKNVNNAGYYIAIQPADMNGDGIEDFVVCPLGPNEDLRWYESDGAQFPTFTMNIIGNFGTQWDGAFVVDLDGDLDMDVIVSDYGGEGAYILRWFENDGNDPPGFGPFPKLIDSVPPGGVMQKHSGIFAADVDGDGDIDIATTSDEVSSVFVFINNGAANPSFSKMTLTTTLSFNAQGTPKEGSIRIADLNGDGFQDVVVGAVGSIELFTNDGTQGAPNFTQSTLANLPGNVHIEIADINGDTHNDVAFATDVGNGNGGILGYLKNDGNPSPFFSQQDIATDGAFDVIEVGDIDLNGSLDIVTTRARRIGDTSGNETRWYESDGAANPSFTKRSIYGVGSLKSIWDMALMDIDRDGDLDILSGIRIIPGGPPTVAVQLLFHTNDLDPSLPTITVHPQSQFVNLPANVVFTITAAPADDYQWRFNGVDLVDGGTISGATTSTLSVTATLAAGGFYECAVSNVAGSVVSATAVLGVGDPGSPCIGDLDGDGDTDAFDFAIWAPDFGCGTGP